MPEMDLYPPTDLMPETYVWFAVWSYMFHPNSDDARRHYMLAFSAEMIGAADKFAASGSGPDERGDERFVAYAAGIKAELTRMYFEPLGGFAALDFGQVHSLDEAPMRQWETVAFIVFVMRAIHDHHKEIHYGASLARAKFVTYQASRRYGLETNTKAIDAAWATYSPVAHLCAALIDLINHKYHIGEPAEALGTFLGLAWDYQCFLQTFRSYSRAEPLISQDRIWLVPESCAIPNLPPRSTALPPDLLKTAKAYQREK